MKNGAYSEITEIGLSKKITNLYFKNMSLFERQFKKGKGIDDPIVNVISAEEKTLIPIQEGMTKQEHVSLVRLSCHLFDAEAVVMFFEASQWTGTAQERDYVIEHTGCTHGHAKAKDVLAVMIETQGKYIVGTADVTSNGKQRKIGKLEWSVTDLPDADYVTYSNFLPTKTSI
ncbi:hypothetical protein [Burkholderia multivorans]|uniref:hypothetical protein n=1 Tax=Burkholderia multivorans TaxID=87883 RepID=UPI0011B250DD|nr:hypothetical protein [Burkholderia multivorans]